VPDTKQYIELLSPARDAAIGIAAVSCGADAVYIGGGKFGARKEAANEMSEIERLIRYSHIYKAKVYLALNTILTESEVNNALNLIQQAWNAGIDGLIIQDFGLLECNLPSIPLIASTQIDNRNTEKIKFLEKCGFSRVILAREFSLNAIRQLRKQTSIELECFIHGSLCVSYSGQCWASFALTGRSANRGECAQICRSEFDLEDTTGRKIIRNKYLLSMKDLNLQYYLKDLMDAGICSFKIEGRLKDASYVKNITAYYRLIIDSILKNNKAIVRPSSGRSIFRFTPDPTKTFNRGYTSYFLNDRPTELSTFRTQKSIGKPVGKVLKSAKGILMTELIDEVHSGDGLCYFNNENELCGFMVNKVDKHILTPNKELDLQSGTCLYRNLDMKFQRKLESEPIIRKISVHGLFEEISDGFRFKVEDEDHNYAEKLLKIEKEKAKKPEQAEISIRRQLSKTGNTAFQIDNLEISWSSAYHLPISILNELRREVMENLLMTRKDSYIRSEARRQVEETDFYNDRLDFSANILNSKAELFYRKHGVKHIEPAVERRKPDGIPLLMTTKYCIKYEIGLCLKKQRFENIHEHKEPLYLRDMNHRYRLEFDCSACEMKLFMDH
jgi:23S rRNA 5-hydroxycytidine C2501 synthase